MLPSNRIAFRAFGVEIDIRFEDADLYPFLLTVLPPERELVAEMDNPQRRYQITGPCDGKQILVIDERRPRRFSTVDLLLDFLEGDIQLFVAEFATPHLFIHAGVVAWNGMAIMLPGRSFAGKSTLVTSLVKAGATYYSDEYAVLDAEGRVLPYLRRVSLRTGPHGPAGRLDFSEKAPQGSVEDHAIPVGLVALLRYNPASQFEVETLPPLRGVMAISEQTVAVQHRPADTFAILGKVVESARVIQGSRGDVEQAVVRLLSVDFTQNR